MPRCRPSCTMKRLARKYSTVTSALRVAAGPLAYARAPKSLSGGETFYASLALALGLADVISAETGGIRLDTLFIDEGFGTLDDEGTLEDVLVVLDELRSGGRAVGVVSHVRELRDRISAQLRIEPGITGSRVIQGEQAGPRGGVPSLREELQRIDDGIVARITPDSIKKGVAAIMARAHVPHPNWKVPPPTPGAP